MKYKNDTGLPSVTTILSPFIDTKWFKKEHTDRGSACHDAMLAHALCIPYYGRTFNPLWKPYVESGKKWFKENIKRVLLAEERLEIAGDYCGQPDLLAVLNSGLIALIDWKTSVSVAKYWRFQLGGYMPLIHANTDFRIDVRMSVRLRRDFGKPCLVNEYNDHEYDIGIFNCCNAAYRELI
jgi:hypothetical protein